MAGKKEEIEISNKEIIALIAQLLEYLKIEAPKQREHKLIHKGMDVGIVLVILLGTAWLGSINVLEGQMVAGLFGAALGYLFGVGRR